ncbi:MAG TPA: multiheme c-type cytochrome [Chthoniobacteraceae bacterium]|nr:multiheme c-type cytochrome [Chthoniobacteraceae bacterium]
MRSTLLVLVLFICAVSPPASAAESVAAGGPRFTGSMSCMSSSCHGGGVGKDEGVIFRKSDRHLTAHGILGTARSAQIAQQLQIEDPTRSARCTVCHSPLQTVPPARFVAGVKPENGVSCESCHGPAEPWLRFHTRKDVTHEQRVAAGLRELESFSARATACIACHMNIDSELVRAGHPEMFFELDGQVLQQPPHYTDTGIWVGPRRWETGQAVALRVLSWKLATKHDPNLASRWRALVWLLRKTDEGAALPGGDDFSTMQSAADRLARTASKTQWSKAKTEALLRKYASLANEFRNAQSPAEELKRRGQVLVLGLDRLWAALKKEGSRPAENFDKALTILVTESKSGFEPGKFAGALEQLEVALEREK